MRAFQLSVIALGASMIPCTLVAASLTYTSFTGEHYHSGGNIGTGYIATTVADRTSAFGPNGAGYVFDTVSDSYGGEISAGRVGTGTATGHTFGQMTSTGFAFSSDVTTEVVCVANPTAATCPPLYPQPDGFHA
ncbi:hypothetical protein ACN2XU_20440 [Primorskyibacter sp. 2E107]|uniref:hypothetical protein n=1 Tax=Primorskyibacter sp. 2E107 TaxID=3403458 RepID=UPI003AF939C9